MTSPRSHQRSQRARSVAAAVATMTLLSACDSADRTLAGGRAAGVNEHAVTRAEASFGPPPSARYIIIGDLAIDRTTLDDGQLARIDSLFAPERAPIPASEAVAFADHSAAFTEHVERLHRTVRGLLTPEQLAAARAIHTREAPLLVAPRGGDPGGVPLSREGAITLEP